MKRVRHSVILDQNISIKKNIGQGASSKVYLGVDKDQHKYAVKILRKEKGYSYEQGANIIVKEHKLLQNLKGHPNILKPYSFNLDGIIDVAGNIEKDIMYNVLEFADNGSLAFFIRMTGHLEEEIARFQFRQLAHATEFIHSQDYAHLDLKLENILLDKYFNVKIADLGSSVYIKQSRLTQSRRGTIVYMAPEVFDLSYGESYDALAADIYSLGVCLHVMLVGEFPNLKAIANISSTADSEMQDSDNIEERNTETIIKKRWKLLSHQVKSLILKMISTKPEDRPSICEILKSKWLSKPFSDEIPNLVYSEMEARKDYIFGNLQKPNKYGILGTNFRHFL